MLRLEETHPVKRTLLAKSNKISGGHALLALFWPRLQLTVHASTDELLQLAADRDRWRREVLRIDPSLVCHSNRLTEERSGPQAKNNNMDIGAQDWLEGATKMDGQFGGGHVKWNPETTKAKVEK